MVEVKHTTPPDEPIGYCVWISPTKLAACAKTAKGSFPVYAAPQTIVPVVTGQMEIEPDVTAADLGVNADPPESVSENLDLALSAMNGCVHDGGFDREIGPIGCYLGDKCVCIGVYPLIAKARATLSPPTREEGGRE